MNIPDVIEAICQETKMFFDEMGGTVLLDTQLQGDISGNFPLCIVEIKDAPESARLPGNGLTRLDINFSLRIHNFEPNAFIDEDNAYSSSLMEIVDTVRVHFENETWLSFKMDDLRSNYGFRLTFAGGPNASEPLEVDSHIAMGYRLEFITICLDSNTSSTKDLTGAHSGTFTETIVFTDC